MKNQIIHQLLFLFVFVLPVYAEDADSLPHDLNVRIDSGEFDNIAPGGTVKIQTDPVTGELLVDSSDSADAQHSDDQNGFDANRRKDPCPDVPVVAHSMGGIGQGFDLVCRNAKDKAIESCKRNYTGRYNAADYTPACYPLCQVPNVKCSGKLILPNPIPETTCIAEDSCESAIMNGIRGVKATAHARAVTAYFSCDCFPE